MIFVKLLIELLFKNNEVNKIVRNSFFTQHCFSLPNSANLDRLIGLRQFKRILQKLWIEKIKVADSIQSSNSTNQSFLYVLFPEYISEKLNYLEGRDKIKGAFSKKNLLLELNFFSKVSFTILNFIFFPFIFFHTFFFKKNRINIALFTEHIIQCCVLIEKLNTVNCKKLYFFFTHEPEANLLAHFLMQQGVNIVKIPNTNPLFMFNKELIASTVVLTLGYQIEEAKYFYKNYNELKFEFWQPQMLDKFYNIEFKNQYQNKLCYYSHASWLRFKEDHHLPWFSEVRAEINLLNQIKANDFLSQYEITVCLHPKEKKSIENFNEAKKYYEGIFGDNVILSQTSSYESFSKFEVGFGAFSTILFERLHCGHKTILMIEDVQGFPLSNSNFNYLTAKQFSDFEEKIKKAMLNDVDDFFENCTNYTFRIER